MPTSWTNPNPVTTTTPMRAVHINEIRTAVNSLRNSIGLNTVTWSDGPSVSTTTAIRAIHFGELRQAIQDLWSAKRLGALPQWNAQSPPSPTRPIRTSDMNDLRQWVNSFEVNTNLPDPQGIVSFLFDPKPEGRPGSYIINSEWVDDVVNLKPAGRRLLIRAPIYSNSDNNNINDYYQDYRTAASLYGSRGFSVAGVLGGSFYRIGVNNDKYDYCPNHAMDVNNPFSNPYIAAYADRAKTFVSSVSSSGLTTFWIWNEPQLQVAPPLGDVSQCSLSGGRDPSSMSPQAFGALLYTTCQQIRSVRPDTVLYAGSLHILDSVSSIDSAKTYLNQMYQYLNQHKPDISQTGYGWDAVSVNIEGGWPASRVLYLWNSLRDVQATWGEFSNAVVGEWGVENRNIPTINPASTYNAIKGYFPTMYFFQHPARIPHDEDDYGSREYDFDDDNHEFSIEDQPTLDWYPILQELYEDAE